MNGSWLNEDQLQRRGPLWSALSDLFLDTETRWYLPRIAGAALDSGYPWDEVESIFRHEVAPVVVHNLYDIAGDWAGFPDDWLHGEILRNGPRASPRGLNDLEPAGRR